MGVHSDRHAVRPPGRGRVGFRGVTTIPNTSGAALPCDVPRVIVDACLQRPEDLPRLKDLILHRLQAPEEIVYDCLLAITEAVANALIHGRRNGVAYCRLTVCRTPDQVRILVEDRGNGFNWGSLPRTMPPPDAPHGRGVHLIRALTDSVAIRSTPEGTRVAMIKRLLPPDDQRS
ncbi:MAG: ATP-binding protein [Armatimonadetes bacterium]|nr:ATP-binding protein [Armatimonadota bacterium]